MWKKTPNQITSSDVELAQPFEVDIKINELLEWWESSHKGFEDIVKFHGEF